PGGFGKRGVEGMVVAAHYARTGKVPYLGLCLGLQVMVIEFARNVLNDGCCDSSEFTPDTAHPVIDLMLEQRGIKDMGGTMRLGSYPCQVKKGTKAYMAYHKLETHERHRHRYEFNNQFLPQFEAAGMVAAGINPETNLVEIMEISSHPWFVGVQFHPEYKSTVINPHPLFVEFVKATMNFGG
ncbi:MAG: C26 family cysteine hydrolase domain-containing family, partial [Bacteroidales bacterium]|nr:C26 family cysteine hydrolase domain-containing family [Bacteroidales bacterium]